MDAYISFCYNLAYNRLILSNLFGLSAGQMLGGGAGLGAGMGVAYGINSQLNNWWRYMQQERMLGAMEKLAQTQATAKVDETKMETEALQTKYYYNTLAQQLRYGASARINALNAKQLAKQKYKHLGNMGVVYGNLQQNFLTKLQIIS